jgi:hypothetical protein
MTTRILTAAVAVAVGAFAVRAADDNPYKDTKVGDFATYTMKVSVGTLNLEGKTRQTVTAKNDKEAKIKVTSNVNGMEVPAQEQTIDLTKPYDPTQVGGLPPGATATVEKGQTGAEKIKIGQKEYETNWTSYKVKAKANNTDIDATVKVWSSKAVQMGMVRLQMTANVAGMQMEMTMELAETGHEEPPKK